MAKSNWVTGSKVCDHFGFSSKHLAQLRKKGTLKKGVHYRHIGTKMAMRPTYRYNLPRIEKDLG